ncbi:hypothetical protein CASFOL_005387 [Castilleja foliolosa]|uniref:3-oxo-5-alpha-steroid 4-dehydrogenase C-terminal domain-containing protein n=1 Tax=Castilleja foliolosa TaxID=1961234 RepID=A0ABD3E7A9_9LAMI
MLNQVLPMAVVWLLRAVWIVGIFPIVIASFPSSKFYSFHNLLLKLSGRGKIMDSSSKKLVVPQNFFCHFYIVAVIWTTFLLVVTWVYAYKTTNSALNFKHGLWKSVFLLLLMETQVLRRLFESIYVFKYSPSARMHIAGYLTGLIFYTAAPLSLCCTYTLEVFEFVADMFAEVKGIDIMKFVDFDLWALLSPLMQLEWHVWIGAAFFSWGWVHQHHCHAILGSLRRNDKKSNDYAIPIGDWFESVSSPHYLSEIVIYGGLVIASGFSDITIWLLFGFVVANLVFAAAETHRWYVRKFDNYPSNRYAIIPFVY